MVVVIALIISAILMLVLVLISRGGINSELSTVWEVVHLIALLCGLVLSVGALVSSVNYTEGKRVEKSEESNELVAKEAIDYFETTDVFVVKRTEKGKGYEKYEVVVEDELLEIIFIDDELGNKRIVVD